MAVRRLASSARSAAARLPSAGRTRKITVAWTCSAGSSFSSRASREASTVQVQVQGKSGPLTADLVGQLGPEAAGVRDAPRRHPAAHRCPPGGRTPRGPSSGSHSPSAAENRPLPGMYAKWPGPAVSRAQSAASSRRASMPSGRYRRARHVTARRRCLGALVSGPHPHPADGSNSSSFSSSSPKGSAKIEGRLSSTLLPTSSSVRRTLRSAFSGYT